VVDHEYESRSDNTLRIVPIGDVHRGNPWMEEERFYKTLDWVEENPCYVILMGDYGECINAKDPRHDYNALDERYNTPDKQYRKTAEDFERIKDKIVCVLDGNHEYNFWRRHNHNYTDWLATDLGAPYTGVSAFIRFKLKRRSASKRPSTHILDVYAHHGWTNARTDGYKVKVIHDLRNIYPLARIYLMGHVHKLGEALPTTLLHVDRRTNKIREFIQYFYFTGSYIKGHEEGVGSYVEARGLPPTMLGSPVIEVRPNRIDDKKDKSLPEFSIRYVTMDWLT